MDCHIETYIYISLKCPFNIVISMKCHSLNVISMSILSIKIYLWNVTYMNWLIYRGRQLYQYSEDDFLFYFLLLTRFFRITSLQVIKEKLFCLIAHLDPLCLCVSSFIVLISSIEFLSQKCPICVKKCPYLDPL